MYLLLRIAEVLLDLISLMAQCCLHSPHQVDWMMVMLQQWLVMTRVISSISDITMIQSRFPDMTTIVISAFRLSPLQLTTFLQTQYGGVQWNLLVANWQLATTLELRVTM